MSNETDKKWFDKKMNRREFLKKAGIGGAGLALGASGVSAFFSHQLSDEKAVAQGDERFDFYGKHQAGIVTPVQKNIYFVVLDLHSTDQKEVIQMLKDWTAYSEKLMAGEAVKKDKDNAYLPPIDTGETKGLHPYRLTLTFGISPSFLQKLGLTDKAPKEFQDLPVFAREQLKDNYTGGDLMIQACADDEQVAFHAVRNLIRKARNVVTMKWSQSGFTAIGDRKETPRNLFGFKDGTGNAHKTEEQNQQIWCTENNWLKDGTYMVVRRIQMFLETWDRTSLGEQENTFGRHKYSGAPMGETDEFAEVDLKKKNSDGEYVIPEDSHVRLAREAGAKIYRRSYSYSDGIDEVTGQFHTGLLFISFQKDPQSFISIQNRLGTQDKMNEYITHIGSGLFACFGGIKKGEYIGQSLFE